VPEKKEIIPGKAHQKRTRFLTLLYFVREALNRAGPVINPRNGDTSANNFQIGLHVKLKEDYCQAVFAILSNSTPPLCRKEGGA